MSLKAKIEAIIYASEEPVTLPQLVGVLGQEAQLELDALDSRQTTLLLPGVAGAASDGSEAGHEDALVPADGAASLTVEPALADEAFRGSDESLASPAQTPHAEASAEGAEPAPDSSSESSEPSEAELKRRQRDRERRLRDYIRSVLDELMGEYARGDRGLEIREVANGFRFATKPEFHDAVRGFVRSLKPPLKLSIQALETLAVVAYRQPVTAPEVSEIRGVDSGGVLGSLLTRKLVTTAGRKQVIGRPILYKTTKEFLLRFGLKDLSELPSIEEFDRIAGELNEAIQEEMPMAADTPASPNPMNEADAPTEISGSRREGRELETTTEEVRSAAELEQAGGSGKDVHGPQADGTPIDGLEPEADAG